MKKLTTEEFISKAKKVHNNKYDYSLTVYINTKTKVKIICPIHGEFEQNPNDHLHNHGCPKCSFEKSAVKKRKTQEEFISKAKKVHNNKYDYSLVNYKNAHSKVKIICPIHGIFEQNPNDHLHNHGCLKCAFEKIATKKRKPQEEFISRAKKVHNNKYDYSLVNYLNNKEKVKIICSIHGEFEQSPYEHLEGKGCPECGKLKRAKSRIKNKSNRTMEKLKKLYPKYDFSNSKYTKAIELMDFVCPKHGKQSMRPNDMLNGHGCPKCGVELRNKDRKLTVEEIKRRSIENHGDVWDFSETVYGNNNLERLKVRCKTCGKINYKPPYRIIYGKCDYCSESQGEKEVRLYLEEHDIKYEQEYCFPECKYIRELPFDFFLPELNTVIEYQGEQHYKKVKFFDDKNRFLKDEIKRKFCLDNGIKELEIKYDESVKKVLDNFLS